VQPLGHLGRHLARSRKIAVVSARPVAVRTTWPVTPQSGAAADGTQEREQLPRVGVVGPLGKRTHGEVVAEEPDLSCDVAVQPRCFNVV
jgi:hypothetical protein